MQHWQKVLGGLLLPWVFIGSSFADGEDRGGETVKAVDNMEQVELEVIDPFVDMHTGPGRGYPVFYVIEQGETVRILTRRPDWYEVRAKGDRQGWVKASQIARTLQPTGEPVDLPSISYGDFLKNSWRVGFSIGPYSKGELEGVDVFTANVGYRPLSWLVLEAEAGNMYGTEIRGELYDVSLVVEPLSGRKLSPTLLVGRGSMKIEAQPKLAPLDLGDSPFEVYAFGINYYIGRSFVVRGEYRQYTVTIDSTKENLSSWKFGFNTSF